MDEEEIFKSLEPLELKAVKRMAEYPPFVKPFQEVYGDIEKNIDKKIQFPSDEEEQGHVAFAWRLPYRLIDGVKIMQGVKILASYLTFTQVRANGQIATSEKVAIATFETTVNVACRPFLRSAP